MKRYRQPDVVMDLEGTPPGATALATRRTSPIVRTWFLTGGYDLNFLIRSIYLQGVGDGWDACERAQSLEKGNDVDVGKRDDGTNECPGR